LFLLLDNDDDQACCMSNKKPKTFRPHKLDTQPGTHPFQWCTSCAGPSIIVVVFFAMAFWSWRKWPDIQIDFGQQLYIPWQLANGKLLHQDIVILHGPLSQYFNAFWFKLFGPSLTVIIFLNLFILAGMTGMIYLTIRRFADSFTATVACVVLLTLFGFSQYVGVGNYNYVTPYTHEATHGMALTVVMIFALIRYFTRGGRLPCAVSGLCLGLVLLTKVEVAIAATIVALIGFASAYFIAPPSVSPKKRELAIFCAAALAPALGFFLYFLSYLTADQALRAVGQGFLVLSNELTKTTFYMRILGLDDPGENFRRMLSMFLGVVIFILFASAVDLAISRVTRSPGLIAIGLGAVSALTLYLNRNVMPWIDILRALPLTTALALAVFITLLKRHSHQVEMWTTILPMVLWTTFALSLLAKMALNVHIYHYGFYLPMPATLVLVICLFFWIPKVLSGTSGSGVVFRSFAMAVLVVAIFYHLNWSQKFYRLKDFAVGQGADTIITYGPKVRVAGLVTALTLEWIEEKTSRGATFVGLPEGIMLNYLSRRTTTVPYVNFMIPEMIVFGEPRMLNDFKSRPPEYVMLVDNNSSEFGVGPFGSDPRNGKQIMDWVNQNYQPVTLIGSEPLQGGNFGIKILKHSERAVVK
jgi:hypothetical protein